MESISKQKAWNMVSRMENITKKWENNAISYDEVREFFSEYVEESEIETFCNSEHAQYTISLGSPYVVVDTNLQIVVYFGSDKEGVINITPELANLLDYIYMGW